METHHKIIDSTQIFDTNFLDHNRLYMFFFGKPLCNTWVNQIDIGTAFKLIKEKHLSLIKNTYQYSQYNRKRKISEFTTTIFVLKNNCVVMLKSDFCDILHGDDNYDFANNLIKEISTCKSKGKKQPFEINIIIKSRNYLELKPMDINKTKLDINLFYEDGFVEIDTIIKNRLNKKKDKGIVLLHGLPGTGKTTYLRHLIGSIKKKVLFVSPAVAQCIMEPDFMELLIDNPDCVLVIEDAENIIMDRRSGGDSSVSKLLNISDGLLADFLNIQVICAFNSSVTMVDSALMRKGRLIAKYEFGKLNVSKSQQLSNYLGFKTSINYPMTVAEISNQNDTAFEPKTIQVLGFRRDAALEN